MPTKIAWTNETWNPTAGCQAVSPGCANCYAAAMTRRLEAMGVADYAGLTNRRHFNGKVRTLPDKLDKPLHWKKPRRIFVNSMSDLFHKNVPFEFVDRVFAVMALCPQHTFQVLTKRPERAAAYFANGQAFPLPNTWLGTSCEDQDTADTRIPHLLRCPAAVRFLSCEPLIAPLDLGGGDTEELGISLVIIGCESGPKRRPCDPDWIKSLVEQCAAAQVPLFVKQFPLGSPHKVSHDPAEWPEWARVRQFPQRGRRNPHDPRGPSGP